MINLFFLFFIGIIPYFSYGNFISRAFTRSLLQTIKEMEVEDINSVHKIDNHLVRRLIVMPLTDDFNPSQASEMYGKIQHGDKCSLPGTIGRLIFEKPYEVPWLFEMKPVRSIDYRPIDNGNVPAFPRRGKLLEKAYISPLDFRSPENYIFLPKWLMKALDLHPNDEVDISFVRIKLATLVVLQPLNLEWDELIEQGHNAKTVLEHEVNKYSSLTSGSVISIEFQKVIYYFFVKEVRAEGNIAVKGVRIQDSDVKVDIDREILDELIEEADAKAELQTELAVETEDVDEGEDEDYDDDDDDDE